MRQFRFYCIINEESLPENVFLDKDPGKTDKVTKSWIFRTEVKKSLFRFAPHSQL
jgi:hypothetical protein